jgi:hypothetical protein
VLKPPLYKGNHQFWVFKNIRGKEPWWFPIPISRKKKESDPKEKPILVTSNTSKNTKKFHCRTDKEPTVFL